MSATPKRGRGRPRGSTKPKKVAVTIMLPVATKDQMEIAVEQTGDTRSAYMNRAVLAQLRKDVPKHEKPDS
jgi:hypothetical protein